jgi:hypothetical protein
MSKSQFGNQVPQLVKIYRGDTLLSETMATVSWKLVQGRGENGRITATKSYNVRLMQKLPERVLNVPSTPINTYFPFVNDIVEFVSEYRINSRLVVESYIEDKYLRFFDIKCSDINEYFSIERQRQQKVPIYINNAIDGTEIIYNYGQVVNPANVSVTSLPFLDVKFYDEDRQPINYIGYTQIDKFKIRLNMDIGLVFTGSLIVQIL